MLSVTDGQAKFFFTDTICVVKNGLGNLGITELKGLC